MATPKHKSSRALINMFKNAVSLKKHFLFFIILLGVFCRTYWVFFGHMQNISGDTPYYFKQADAILKGGYINYYPNGYPFIIALVKICFGSNFIFFLLILNIIMSSSIIYFTYHIADELFHNQSISLICAVILAIFPSQLNISRWIMSEVPCSFFLLGAYFLYFENKKILSGLFIGMAIIIRTEMAIIAIALLILDSIFEKKISISLLSSIVFAPLMITLYSYIKIGEFSLAGHNVYNIIVATTASGDHVDFQLPFKNPEIKTTAQALKMYIDFFKVHPSRFLKNRIANLWTLWGFYSSAFDGGPRTFARIITGAGNFFLIFFGLIAWVKMERKKTIVLIIIPFLVITFIHVIYFAFHRYVCPIEPFMIILSAWTINLYLPDSLKHHLTSFAGSKFSSVA